MVEAPGFQYLALSIKMEIDGQKNRLLDRKNSREDDLGIKFMVSGLEYPFHVLDKTFEALKKEMEDAGPGTDEHAS